jgi:DNA primase
MISKNTIDRIFEAAHIEDVVGEYVKLKKAGANLKGNCPFHNEKTPSFSVSPAKGIFKCFGCGKAGNSVNFIMEYDNLSYVEALRRLANRYSIEVEEDRNNDPEYVQKNQERESIGIALEFAKNYFVDLLQNNTQGKAIGYSYFVNRGLREDTIDTFQLGYSLDDRTAFLSAAIKNGFLPDVLLKAGLIKPKDNVNSEDPLLKYYDAFRDRVMFPVYGLTGKVLGFGGRRLRENNGPKYLNSAETEFYHKSELLYGMHLAKKSIREKDECFLVEGYLDVITLYQNGLQNVVASSGTALTEGQIKLIKRFTDNITVLYDADPAGLKASTRSIDLVLQQGMNINIAMLPEGEDPDTLCKTMGGEAFEAYIKEHALNFVIFKTKLYSEDAKRDPILKTKAIRDILESIVLIPDPLKRSAFIKECAKMLDADERIMQMEAAKLRRGIQRKESSSQEYIPEPSPNEYLQDFEKSDPTSQVEQELALIKSVILYSNNPFTVEDENEEAITTVLQFVLSEIELDGIEIEHPEYKALIDDCKKLVEQGEPVDEDYFVKHPTSAVLAAEVLSEKYKLSPVWFEGHEIYTMEEKDNFKNEVMENLNYLKLKHLEKMIVTNLERLKTATDDEESMKFMGIHANLLNLRHEFATKSGIVIMR